MCPAAVSARVGSGFSLPLNRTTTSQVATDIDPRFIRIYSEAGLLKMVRRIVGIQDFVMTRDNQRYNALRECCLIADRFAL